MKKADTNDVYNFAIHEKDENASLPKYNSLRTTANHTDRESSISSMVNFATAAEGKSKWALEGRLKSFDFSNSDETQDAGHAAERYSTSCNMKYSSVRFENDPNQIQDTNVDTFESSSPVEVEDFSQLAPTYATDEPMYSTLNPVPIYEDILDDSPLLEDKHQPACSIYEQTYSILNPVPIYEDISDDSPVLGDKHELAYSIDEPTYTALNPIPLYEDTSDYSPLFECKRKLTYYTDESSYSPLNLASRNHDLPKDFPGLEKDKVTTCLTLKSASINEDIPHDFPGVKEDSETACSALNPGPLQDSMDDRLGPSVNSVLEENASILSWKNWKIASLHTQDSRIKEQEGTQFTTNISNIEDNDKHAFEITASSNLNLTPLDKDTSEKSTYSSGRCTPIIDEEDIQHNRDSVLEYYNIINQEWRSSALVLGPVLKDMRVQFRHANYLLNHRNDPSNLEECRDDLQSHIKELTSIFRRLKNTIKRTEKLGKICKIQKKRITESYFRSCSLQRFDCLTSRKRALILELLGNLKKIKSSMKRNHDSVRAYHKCKSKILSFPQN